MPSYDSEALSGQWTSLFLPLEEDVLFASFITLLCSQQQEQQQDERHREFSNAASDAPSALEVAKVTCNANADETRSPLFALCGERADTIACVLVNRDVVFYDMTDGWQGPKEIRRLCGTKSLRGCSYSEATCASLIPLDVAYMCRVTGMRQPRVGTESSSNGNAVAEAKRAAAVRKMSPSGGGTMYLRGVVGSADGRVDVFSEHGYVFGFVAHDSAVVGVSAIYTSSDSAAGNDNDASVPRRQYDTMLSQHESADGRSFEDATANLGFVTCGNDGVLYVWRRQGLFLKPEVLDRSACFSRTLKWNVVQPFSRDWLLDGMGAVRVPLLVYTTPGLEHKLRIRSTMTLEDVEPSVELPGACFTRTTAVVSNGEMALVARGRKVYHVTFANSRCEFLFTARYTVDGLYTGKGSVLAAATCDREGLMYILTLEPIAVLGFYSVHGGGNIRSVSLHPASQLVTVVGGNGVVEVAKMPDEWCAATGRKGGAAATKATTAVVTAAAAAAAAANDAHPSFNDVADAIPAARVLHCLAELQDEGSDSHNKSLSERQRAVAQEALLLARMTVPKETKRYLQNNSEVL